MNVGKKSFKIKGLVYNFHFKCYIANKNFDASLY